MARKHKKINEMKINVNDRNIKEIVRNEVARQNLLIRVKAINVNEINLNHIDVTNVSDFSELFKDMEFEKPLNIESWNFENCKNAIKFWKSPEITVNHRIWRS